MTTKTLPERHPNLSRELNDQVAQTLIEGGSDLRKLETGRVREVTTRNTRYRIERVHDGEKNFPFLMSGHQRICPEAKRAAISGSSYGGGMLRIGFIGRGMQMEFQLASDDRRYTTTEVRELVETGGSAAAAKLPRPSTHDTHA